MNFKSFVIIRILVIAIAMISWTIPAVFGQNSNNPDSIILNSETPQPSGGSYMLHQRTLEDYMDTNGGLPITSNGIEAIGNSFEGFNFDDNSTETGGWRFIPPDPIGAAGTDQLIAVVNVMIEARDKTGTLLWRDALQDFFSSTGGIGTLGTFTFDPKVVWDHYANRFVVVTLEHWDTFYGDPSNESRILVAVSKTATPATATSADWYFTAINAEESIGGWDHWVDYPGFEVDEEAVYITGHMFAHPGGSTNYRVRLWIIDKGVRGGFYGGGTASVVKHDPIPGGYYHRTTMPALVYGSGGVGGTIGTYLVSYSGLYYTVSGNEAIQVIRIDNPLGSTSFTGSILSIGNMDNNGSGMPDAPQFGTSTLIETNDRRVLDVVWRNDQLWFTTTVVPTTAPNNGQATAHWVKLNVGSGTWPPTYADRGHLGGEDIHISGNVYTFFPSVAVNDAGDAYFGFSASSASIYPGAYCAGRKSGDAAGTVRASETVHAGTDYYQRTFGGSSNRWGDYSGASLDPTDDNLFWIFNEYAMTRGNGTAPEDGRWGTAWASFSFVQTEFTNGANVSLNFSQSSPSPPETDWPFGQFSLNSSATGATFNSVTVNISGTYSGLNGANPFLLKASNTNNIGSATAIGSDASVSAGSVTFSSLADALPLGLRYYWVTVDLLGSASGTISSTVANSAALDISGGSFSNSSGYGVLNSGSDVSLPVQLNSFNAENSENGIVLNWITESEIENLGFILERKTENDIDWQFITDYTINDALKGQGNSSFRSNYSYLDENVILDNQYEYRIADVSYTGVVTYLETTKLVFEDNYLPKKFALNNAYPNPFNPVTNIRYGLPKEIEVNITIFDITGRKIKTLINSKQEAGWYDVQWNGANEQNNKVSSGMYLYKMAAENFAQVRKILLIR